MYKVFKDNHLFILASSNDIPHIDNAITICIKNINEIKSIIDRYDGNIEPEKVIILFSELELLITTFEGSYISKIAAGGWVYNDRNELLMINRLDHWDIPKGHIDKNETLEACAIREVIEETGISNIVIEQKLGVSRHIFRYSDNEPEILKITYWYKMKSAFTGKFIPQTNEDIIDVRWISKSNMELYIPKMYTSLQDFYFENIY